MKNEFIFFQAVNRAFHFAKNKSQGDSKHGDDLLEFREFRLFLQTLRQFFEYYQAFARYVCTNYSAGKNPKKKYILGSQTLFASKAKINVC